MNLEETTDFENCVTPQQSNSEDCGVFLLLITETIIANIIKASEQVTLNLHIDELDIWTKRLQVGSMLYNNTSKYKTLKQLISMTINSKPTTYKDSKSSYNVAHKEHTNGKSVNNSVQNSGSVAAAQPALVTGDDVTKYLTIQSHAVESGGAICQIINGDVCTQTSSPVGETSLPLTVACEITNLKERQQMLEHELKKLAQKVSESKIQGSYKPPIYQQNTNSDLHKTKVFRKTKSSNMSSVSLQIAKHTEATKYCKKCSRKQSDQKGSDILTNLPITQRPRPITTVPSSRSQVSQQKVTLPVVITKAPIVISLPHRTPPALAKVRKEGESYDEFFNRYIDEYKLHITSTTSLSLHDTSVRDIPGVAPRLLSKLSNSQISADNFLEQNVTKKPDTKQSQTKNKK
ncbi:hypothetical protein J6590_069424 [Homalodisca vitripennis]|nr:hypothetical protein J6590_069424 [Homalodisca vitripennis]